MPDDAQDRRMADKDRSSAGSREAPRSTEFASLDDQRTVLHTKLAELFGMLPAAVQAQLRSEFDRAIETCDAAQLLRKINAHIRALVEPSMMDESAARRIHHD